MQQLNSPSKYLRRFFHVRKIVRECSLLTANVTTVIESMDHDQSHKCKPVQTQDFRLRNFMEMDNDRIADITTMTNEELDDILQDLVSKNRDKKLMKVLKECLDKRKFISLHVLKKLFRYYSISGKIDVVELLQKYCMKVDFNSYIRNGKFMHYLAKAHCMKGNSNLGLSVLKRAYIEHEGLRSFYRVIFRELIYDSVLNRSEASCVIFKKYVLEFSETFNDHYPLICYWHVCWSSSWYSDQMTSSDLLDTSNILQEILRDKASIFSINFLREYNEDAVVRILQSLLKYDMKDEYAKVLQILFNYKLRNKDFRGCTEIVKNCETLGISLSSDQQGRYIKMLIFKDYYTEEKSEEKPKQPAPKNFKLMF